MSTEKIGMNPKTKDTFWRRLWLELYKNKVLYLLCIVPLVFLILFKYFPMYGVQIAFREYKITRGFTDGKWVGLKYFKKFVESYSFGKIMWNTFALNLYQLVTFPCALILALMLNYMTNQHYKKFIQTVSYAPHFLSTVVMCGLVLQFLDTRSGLVNIIRNVMGAEVINYMGEQSYWRTIYVLSGLWQGVGYSSIIYIASLTAVSPELHEAAICDGASILQRVWHIDIPSVLPTFCILLIMRCGSMMGSDFEKVLLLQNDLNHDVSDVISTYTYDIGINAKSPQYSYSSAIGLFVTLINVVMMLIVNFTSHKLTNNSLF